MNPQIPTKPCVVCGVKTNETQSIIGIAHYKCYIKAEIPKPICDKLAFLAGVVG